jgi:aminoglycoside phosphotransferase family enzyme
MTAAGAGSSAEGSASIDGSSPGSSPAAHLEYLLDALRNPAAYPHPATRVAVVQTHGSCVFLAGEFAYKLKKPLNFGFLDYSTPELREAACRREVLLNARLCPEVYLGVLPVVTAPGPGAPARIVEHLVNPATVLDWVVWMRRLPAAEMLPRRLAAGTVGSAEIREIAHRLVRFHADCECDAEVRRWGTAAAMKALVQETSVRLVRAAAGFGRAKSAARVAAALEAWLDHHSQLLETRVADARIRAGHGDLRAQNICLAPGIDGGVQIFDCIEFDDRFRCLDVAADLAYLAMDLDLTGRPDLRELLIREYAAGSGDDGLNDVLLFHQCYRAVVRSLIGFLAASEGEIPSAERAGHRRVANAALRLAERYLPLL